MSDAWAGERGFDYPRMMREALREVPREALRRVAESGMPEPHHFYLTFRTDHPGVEVAEFLSDRYPDEMTVILQHQFWDLEVDDEAFSVGLSFSGRVEYIRIPFRALTAFIDPAAEFGLRFDGAPPDSPDDDEHTEAPTSRSEPGEVVSIDKFRKK